ncbi:glycoside hydrolase family 16 protein [Serendipita vermifera MAFF 305830]|uniref:Glycoside hydrolase family 16 protein n=1 Tax=Serendipita vermifera MAFF 305830 TaxID=933852 RepID=A0A0C3BJ56_SERVB|nr:glycoside hydrolase family 16 protein [Serendipita vermifera MAFF 305830]
MSATPRPPFVSQSSSSDSPLASLRSRLSPEHNQDHPSEKQKRPLFHEYDEFGSLDTSRPHSSGPGSHYIRRSLLVDFNSATSHLSKGIPGKFALHPDPSQWGYDVSPRSIDEDDWLHKPNKNDNDCGSVFTQRGVTTLGCISLLLVILIGLFLGYPLATAILHKIQDNNGGYNMGGINATGQVMQTSFTLIDKDTPQDAYMKSSLVDGRAMQLVFSDEFEVEGRSFYPGDDPYWEAVDLYYWGTGDLEWYDPQQIQTKDGKLVIEFREQENHELRYMGGMMTTWNKFCFTGGYIEAKVQLPGESTTSGFWPAIWTMGNLGRAGYGATTDGLWPYSYEACDQGTLKNQSYLGEPDAQALRLGDSAYGYSLSYLPGQRLSSCTCPGEAHPGPVNLDGTFHARSAPEIDVFEAQKEGELQAGAVSQSCQFAPYNAYYSWDNATNLDFHQPEGTQRLNGFKGNVYQQAASVVSNTDELCYEKSAAPYHTVYGFQYKPGYESDNAYITWINNDKLAWTLHAGGMGPDPLARISERVIPQEPMYIIMNLGMSPKFSDIDPVMPLPATMSVDYVRVYQYPDQINYGCDPVDYPTTSYINRYIEAYTNPNLTTWSSLPEAAGYNQPFPKNRLIDTC